MSEQLSVAKDIKALALINIQDIFRFTITATDEEIEDRYGSEARAIEVAEKYLEIAMRTSVLEYDLKGWSVTYSVPIKDKNERIEKTAYFYDKADRKTEPTISKMEQVDKDINVRSKDCETCKHYKLACELFSEICKYEPTTQTETQNSNLTFKTLEYCDICDHKGCEECIANALDEHCIPSQFKKQIEDECAKEYEELGLKELKELIKADRKTENSSEIPNNCDTCRHKGEEGCEQPCLGCGCCGLYEPKDEPTTQTETQNSNLTFKKRTMRDCYNCKRSETEGECIECHYEPKDEPHTMLNDGTLVINVEDATKVSRVLVGDDKNRGDLYYPDDEDEPQTDCAWR